MIFCRTIAWGERRGQKVERIGQYQHTQWTPPKGARCAYLDGFSLHANVAIGAHDREGLEHLCRYITRPAMAHHRLSEDFQGNIRYLNVPKKSGQVFKRQLVVYTSLDLNFQVKNVFFLYYTTLQYIQKLNFVNALNLQSFFYKSIQF